MNMRRRAMLTMLAGITGLGLALTGAAAQEWPTKPVRIIVPFPPGGSVDQLGRRVQPMLQKVLGQPIVIENKGGAAGSIGAAAAAASAPDGYTFLLVFDTHGVNPSLIKDMPFDTKKDLAPILLIGRGAMVIAAHESAPYKSFGDIVTAAKATPGKVPYGTISQGSLAHLAMTSVSNAMKFEVTHVPYKGGGPLVNDATAGHVPLAMATIALLNPHIQSGKLKPLAVTSLERAPQLPDVPTIAELGLPGFAADAWWGMFAPAKTPEPIITKMREAMIKALEDPGVKQGLVEQGIRYDLSTPADFAKFLEGEIDRWAKVVADNKIAAE